MWKVLEKRPLTRLGRLSRARTHEDILDLVDAYSLKDNEFYFDRDPVTFNCILNFYRTGRLHVIDEICILDYADDLDFWMIKDINLEICCVDKFTMMKEHTITEATKAAALGMEEKRVPLDFGDGYFSPWQRALWDLFEDPQSSLAAKILSLVSISLVLVSLVGMCLNTFTWLQAKDVDGEPVDNPKLALLETICISYFSVEFLLRLAGAPQKVSFLKEAMNVVDMLAIAPFYLSLFFVPKPEIGGLGGETTMDPSILTTTMDPLSTTMPMEEEEKSAFGSVGRLMQVFRIARILRIFKLARRSVGLQSIMHTVKTSWKDLLLLFMLVGMGMLVFGSLLYYIENGEEETGFTSIPQGMWWAVQTLTSLGYGDFGVQSVLGKCVGACCAVCGVLVMALPIPIVVDNFADYYDEQKKIEAAELKMDDDAKEDVFKARAALAAKEALLESLFAKPGPFSSTPTSPEQEARLPHNGLNKI